jgi:hypothetical protein
MPIPHTNFNRPRVHPPVAGSTSTLDPSSGPVPLTASVAPRDSTGIIRPTVTRLTDNGQMLVRRLIVPDDTRAVRDYGEPLRRIPSRINAFGDSNLFQTHQDSLQQEDEPVLDLDLATNRFGRPRPSHRTNAVGEPNHIESGQPLPRRPNRTVANNISDNQRDLGMILTLAPEGIRQNDRGPRSSSSGLNVDLTPMAEFEVTHDEDMIALRGQIRYLQERLRVESRSRVQTSMQLELVHDIQECMEELDQRERDAAAAALNQAPLTAAPSRSPLTPPRGFLPVATIGLDLSGQMTYLELVIRRLLAIRHVSQQSDESEEHQAFEDELAFRVEELRWVRIRARGAARETADPTPLRAYAEQMNNSLRQLQAHFNGIASQNSQQTISAPSTRRDRPSPWFPSSQPR